MSKPKNNKKGNAAKVATKVSLADKKSADAKSENSKAEDTQQVADNTSATQEKKSAPKPAANPKQEKNQEVSKKETKKEEKKEEKKPTQQTADKGKKSPKIPTIIPEVEEKVGKIPAIGNGIPIGSNRSSADAKAMLAYVGYQRFINNEEYKNQSPESYANTARSIDAVWLLGMIDIKNEFAERSAAGEFVCKLPAEQIFRLQDIADSLGITLAEPKALPGKENEGQLAIDFNSPDTKIPEELKENKSEAPAKPISLDPKDINSLEELVTVLDHLMRKDRNIATNIVNTVEWYRVYCINKEDNAEKKIELDNRTVAEWIEEIFHIINSVPLMNGLGRTVYLYTAAQGSPVSAHSLLHKHMAPCGWSEEQIASTLKVLLQENFRYKLKSDENLKATDDKALQAVIGNVGRKYIDDLFNTISAGVTSKPGDKDYSEQQEALKLAKKQFDLVSQNYFPEGQHPSKDEVRMKIGQIINLYRDPMDRLAEYEEGIITPTTGEFPPKEDKVEKKS
jgi:hypothetical protein